MKPVITLKRLQQEGRLTLGDTLHHSEAGDHEFIGATSDGRCIVLDSAKIRHIWSIDFGPDCRVVPVGCA